jgi:hypothetical protein
MNPLAETLLNKPDLTTEPVHVPEWDVTLYVRSLTGADRDAFELTCITQRGKNKEVNLANIRARLLVFTVVDENGDRIFTEADAVKLGAKSSKVIDRLFTVAARLSGMTTTDVAELSK